MKGRKPLTFTDFEALKRWLETTTWGADVMRDVLYGKFGERFTAEHLARAVATLPDSELPAQPTYVLVELHGDGFVKVYGERHVRAKIVNRPLTHSKNLALAANLIDELIWLDLKPSYRNVYYPTNCRAQDMHHRHTVKQRIASDRKREFELGFIEVCNRIGGGK